MNNKELEALYQRLEQTIHENGCTYDVEEGGVLRLFHEMVDGKANRKDFLVYAIKEQIWCMKLNKIKPTSSLFFKFARIYGVSVNW